MSELKLSVDFLLKNRATAVRCATENEAKQFIAYLKAHYPKKCKDWDVGETHFDEYPDGIGYTFFWTNGHRWYEGQLKYGSVKFFRRDEYTVVDFHELMEVKKPATEV